MSENLEKHEQDYKEDAWKKYTVEEYQWWIKLFCKRSTHRINQDKRAKDIYDARNYLSMLDNRIKETGDEPSKTIASALHALVSHHQELCKEACDTENCACAAKEEKDSNTPKKDCSSGK